jgi:hypothetical protein
LEFEGKPTVHLSIYASPGLNGWTLTPLAYAKLNSGNNVQSRIIQRGASILFDLPFGARTGGSRERSFRLGLGRNTISSGYLFYYPYETRESNEDEDDCRSGRLHRPSKKACFRESGAHFDENLHVRSLSYSVVWKWEESDRGIVDLNLAGHLYGYGVEYYSPLRWSNLDSYAIADVWEGLDWPGGGTINHSVTIGVGLTR